MLFSDCVHDPVNGLDKNQIHQHRDVLDIVLPVSCANMLVVSWKVSTLFPLQLSFLEWSTHFCHDASDKKWLVKLHLRPMTPSDVRISSNVSRLPLPTSSLLETIDAFSVVFSMFGGM